MAAASLLPSAAHIPSAANPVGSLGSSCTTTTTFAAGTTMMMETCAGGGSGGKDGGQRLESTGRRQRRPRPSAEAAAAAAAAAAACAATTTNNNSAAAVTATAATFSSFGKAVEPVACEQGWDEVRFPASAMYFSPAPLSCRLQHQQQQQHLGGLTAGLSQRALRVVAEENESDEEDDERGSGAADGNDKDDDDDGEPFPEEVFFSHSAAVASCLESRRIVQWKSAKPLRFLRPRNRHEFEHGEALDNAVEEAAARNANGVLVQGGLKIRILNANECLILLDNDKITGKGQQSLSDMFLKMSLR